MNLYEKIKQLYPSITDYDFNPFIGTILLQNDSGSYFCSLDNLYIC
jgi:hypothetical protein